jgi:site-specific recombinase XerD
MLDTGVRSAECLGLRIADIDLDNLIQVMGKGSRERKVPISLELRKRLYPWIRGLPAGSVYLLPNRSADPVEYCNASHDLNEIGHVLGLRLHFHLLRHTFATNYIRQGGDPARLQRILGHSSIETTMKYVHLQTSDLQQVHQQFSILARSAGSISGS